MNASTSSTSPNAQSVSNVFDYESPAKKKRTVDRIFLALLIAGILLRLIVLCTASAFNADDHLGVIEYIAQHHSLPRANELAQSYHPPLYYLLMTPLWGALVHDGSVSLFVRGSIVLHIASAVMSIATLLILARAIDRHQNVFTSAASRRTSLAFACFLPQFVMFGSFISNDTLAFLIGALVFASTLSFTDAPTKRRMILLGVMCGLGLLTKGTFLLTGLALAPIVWSRVGMKLAIIFCLIWLVVGCEKYVENTIRVGRPLVHNMDGRPQWVVDQKVWRGWQTLVDFDIVKLIRNPILQPRNPFGYPLLMYATFWYPHIPDSSYRASIRGHDWVGSLLYAAAIVPTVIFFIGCVTSLKKEKSFKQSGNHSFIGYACLAMVIANVGVVLAAGMKFDAWSCFQSRLCFQSIGPILVLFAVGFDRLRNIRRLRVFVDAATLAAIALCLLYFVVEVSDAYGLLRDQPERVAAASSANGSPIRVICGTEFASSSI